MFNFVDVKKAVAAFPDAVTYILVGTRGVGKSFSPEVYCLEDAIWRGRQFCLVGRFKEDVMPATIANTFQHMTEVNPHTKRIPVADIVERSHLQQRFEHYALESRAGQIWLVGRHDLTDPATRLCQVGVYTSVQTAERFKRGTYPSVYNIFFDEFITSRFYIRGAAEPVEFEKIVNTIFRAGKDGKIFMAGNPDNEVDMNPYLANYNIFYDEMESNVWTPCAGGRVVFCKITNTDTEYIVKKTVSMFGSETHTAFTGEVDRPKTKRIPDGFFQRFSPVVEMRVETSGIMAEGDIPHRRAFYFYVGLFDGALWGVTTEHHQQADEAFRVVCKYDRNELPPPDRQGRLIYCYRFNFPAELARLGQWVREVVTTGKIYHETDKIANLLHNIMLEA